MNWLEICVFCTKDGADAACGALYSEGVSGVEIIDGIDEVKQYFTGAEQRWDYIDYALLETQMGTPCVRAYLSADDSAIEQLENVKFAINRAKQCATPQMGSFEMSIKTVADEDWANNWKQYFEPIKAGERLLVCPTWMQVAPEGRTVYKMDSCALFGTGQHVSTQFCLNAVDAEITRPKRVLDLGAGSGILSICAMLLGAKYCCAVEIEPHAKEVIKENALLNGVDLANYDILVGDAINDKFIQEKIGTGYDLVLANIVADVIIALAPHVMGYLKPGATFVCSGIIDERLDEVIAKLTTQGFVNICHQIKEGWCAISCKAPE